MKPARCWHWKRGGRRRDAVHGPVFRKIDCWGRLGTEALHPDAVRQILRKRAAAAGLTVAAAERSPVAARAPRRVRHRSLRGGARDEQIMAHTRHRDLKTMRGYACGGPSSGPTVRRSCLGCRGWHVARGGGPPHRRPSVPAGVRSGKACCRRHLVSGRPAATDGSVAGQATQRGRGEHPASAAVEVLCLPSPDWLAHRLDGFRADRRPHRFPRRRSRAGVIPGVRRWLTWRRAGSPAWWHCRSHQRGISVAGAHIVADQLREAVEIRGGIWRSMSPPAGAGLPARFARAHPGAAGDAGRRAERSDVHRSWLWEHRGTTWPLRHVTARPAPAASRRLPDGPDRMRFRFHAADWSPWPALRQIRARWPALRFDLRPVYGSQSSPALRRGDGGRIGRHQNDSPTCSRSCCSCRAQPLHLRQPAPAARRERPDEPELGRTNCSAGDGFVLHGPARGRRAALWPRHRAAAAAG